MALNYDMVVSTLFEFRERLKEFSTTKNQTVVKLLESFSSKPSK